MNQFFWVVLFVVFSLSASLGGCGQQNESSGKTSENADLFKLAHMNGCIDCHSVQATVIGPSWKAVAERYKDAPLEEARAILIASVKNGSQGKYLTWKGGDGMPPLEKRVSTEHIETLVDFILSLNQKNKP